MRMEQNGLSSNIEGRCRKIINGTQHTQKESLYQLQRAVVTQSACRARSVRSDSARYIAGAQSQHSPPSIYIPIHTIHTPHLDLLKEISSSARLKYLLASVTVLLLFPQFCNSRLSDRIVLLILPVQNDV